MSGALGQRGDLANDNRRPALSLGLGAPSEPAPAEWEQGGERPRGHGRSASRLFGARGGTASDDDSSAATLSQGSPAGSSARRRSPFAADADLPAGWLRVQDASGPYYWHVPTGTTQWEPP
ncbi:amyloid beta precursor protein binding family B member 1-like, partial [Pelecanus crispus]|uniref:amyloid beta precursor protein binding family B member 1-like n=1 Tax=Pelecanus crispus TaxID=36300 RepID=UPI003F5D0932